MKMKVYYHDNCFDGLASAAVFSHFYRHRIRDGVEFEYEGLAHRPGQLFPGRSVRRRGKRDRRFQIFERSTIDLVVRPPSERISECGRRSSTSGPTSQRQEIPRSDVPLVHDVHCPHGEPAFRASIPERLKELIHWADIIDGAQFPDARAPWSSDEPAMKLMMVIEGVRDPVRTRKLIQAFQEHSLQEIMAIDWVQAAFRPLYERHLKSDRHHPQACAIRQGNRLLRHQRVRRHGRIQQVHSILSCSRKPYCVGVSRSSFRSKISVGSNPWSPAPRTHNLAALCERHGGGGHPVVGAISFDPEDLSRARRIARGIAQELRDRP